MQPTEGGFEEWLDGFTSGGDRGNIWSCVAVCGHIRTVFGPCMADDIGSTRDGYTSTRMS